MITLLVHCGKVPGETEAGTVGGGRVGQDAASILIFRDGLADILAYVDARPEVFRPEVEGQAHVPAPAARDELRNTWKAVLDYSLALESIQQYHKDFLLLDGKAEREDSFLVFYAAFLAQYRFALDFLQRLDGHPTADVILNEAVPELGLHERTFAAYKYRFLHLGIATEFASGEVILETFRRGRRPALRAVIAEDSAAIWRQGKGTGERLTLKNAMAVVRDSGSRAWLPVQKSVSEWMGDVKVRRKGVSLISPEQIRSIRPRLQPGDILLQRREWYLSNVGLPGFWTHAALYVGTAEERAAYFSTDGVRRWVRAQGEESGELEKLLASRYPDAYRRSTRTAGDGHLPRVLEAVGEGVLFTTLEHSAEADSMVVLRPRLTPAEKAVALDRSFHYSGRPYDFDFDFTTDAALVCSELIYKAYEPSADFRGLRLPLIEVMGRPVSPPNETARMFDEEYGAEDRQLEMVLFLDGYERAERAVASSAEAFRASWRRPKWHILVQDDLPPKPED